MGEFYAMFASKARNVIDHMFDMVAQRLGNTGLRFLGGDSLGIDDIIFASHASWLFFPAEFGSGVCTRWPQFGKLPPKYQAIANGYKATVAGKLVMDLYARYRNFGPTVVLIEC